MRNAFAEELEEIADKDERIILLAGDIGFRIFDKFIEKFPNRFLNCGIAEQNMISVAAGIASEGKIPVVYTIIPFLIMRAYEQIRVDLGINSQNVILVGVGGGLAYDKLGSTHHACEDIALMRTIPNLEVFTPYDPENVKDCLTQAYNTSIIDHKSSYIRLSKGGEKNLKKTRKLNKNLTLINSNKISNQLIISHGSIVSKLLDYFNDNLNPISIIAVSKINEKTIRELTSEIDKMPENSQIMFIEEHFQNGGLYEAMSPQILSLQKHYQISNLCINHQYTFDILPHEELIRSCGIDFKKVKQTFNL